MTEKILALKISVNSYAGTRNGVPRLLDLLACSDAHGTFYFSMGPDNSGKTLKRIFTQKGYLNNLLRSGATSGNNLIALLYGTLLPAPMIAESFPDILKSVESAGHQVGIHSWDHVKWEDYLPWFPKHLTAMELGRAAARFEDIFGYRAVTTAAPGGVISLDSLEVQDAMGLDFCCDSSGTEPFYPVMSGRRFRTLQIPTTLPTALEIIRTGSVMANNLHEFYWNNMKEGLNVLSISPEQEGNPLLDSFARLMNKLRGEGIRVISMAEAAAGIISAPASELFMGEIPGRTGKVAIQGSRVP
jgi:peptidoglycan/xylan/chitin deacetylase (PgdA/CDA1 family)